jgi:hypothetical protein
VADLAERQPGVAVIALDRWGRALLVRDERGLLALPAAPLGPDEPPDAAALRLFEAVAGVVLEQLRLARVWRAAEVPAVLPWPEVHLYFDDPDLDPAVLPCEARAVGPDEVGGLPLDPWVRSILEAFFESPAYRALFH